MVIPDVRANDPPRLRATRRGGDARVLLPVVQPRERRAVVLGVGVVAAPRETRGVVKRGAADVGGDEVRGAREVARGRVRAPVVLVLAEDRLRGGARHRLADDAGAAADAPGAETGRRRAPVGVLGGRVVGGGRGASARLTRAAHRALQVRVGEHIEGAGVETPARLPLARVGLAAVRRLGEVPVVQAKALDAVAEIVVRVHERAGRRGGGRQARVPVIARVFAGVGARVELEARRGREVGVAVVLPRITRGRGERHRAGPRAESPRADADSDSPDGGELARGGGREGARRFEASRAGHRKGARTGVSRGSVPRRGGDARAWVDGPRPAEASPSD